MGSLPLFSKVGKGNCEWEGRILNLSNPLGTHAPQAEDLGQEFIWK